VLVFIGSCQKSDDSATWCYAAYRGWANMAYLSYETSSAQQSQPSSELPSAPARRSVLDQIFGPHR
jgi:hypothetical protein